MTSSLEDATVAIAAEWQAACNARDMSRMAALLTPDVDFVNVLGSHCKGSAEVEHVHAALHTAQFHDSVWENNENNESQAKLLGPDLGLAHLRWSIRGDFDPDGTPRAPRSGRSSWVLLRDGERMAPSRRAQHEQCQAAGGLSLRTDSAAAASAS